MILYQADRAGCTVTARGCLQHPIDSIKMLVLLVLMALAVTPFSVSAQVSSEETAEAPDAQCRAATDMGTVALPYELEDSLEADDPSTRVDFYRFEAEPGQFLRADMTDHATEPDTMHNPLLGLFTSNCDWYGRNDDLVEIGVTSLDARLDFTVPQDGIFILAAAASPDEQFNGSSDDTGTYTLRIDIAPTPPVVEPDVESLVPDTPIAMISRAPDGRIDVNIDTYPYYTGYYTGYDIYRDDRYFTTVRPAIGTRRFRIDGGAGEYCLVGFVEDGDTTRYSVCSDANTVGPGGPSTGAPSAPRALRGTIYSPGVAELFWLPATDDGRIVGYRVTRDGIDLGTTDGTSYFEGNIEPTRTYRYRVSAIDDDGLEGTPARLEIQATVGGEVPPQELFDSDLAPAPPGAISGVLYSPGVVEIFWERSVDHLSIAGYEVSRNGERVAFHKGLSHFEQHLPMAVAHIWSVVSVSADGSRSTPRRLRLVDEQFTPLEDAPSDAIIRRETYATLLGHAFDIYVGDLYSPSMHALYGLNQRMSDLEVSRDSSDNPVLFGYACDDGRADLALFHFDSNNGEIYDWTFDNCLFDDLLYQGDLSLHQNALGQTFGSTGGVTIRRSADIAVTFSGMAQWWRRQTLYSDAIGSWDTVAFALNSRTIDGDLDIAQASSRFAYGYENSGRFSASLSGGFDVRSDVTGGALLHVSTPLALDYERSWDETLEPANTWNFSSGQLELVAEDGSRLLLDADTGDADTMRITIDNERGPDTFLTRWSQWQSRLRFDRYPRDVPGRLTAPVSLPDATPGPAITPDNYLALLDYTFDLYAGIGYARPLTVAHELVADTDPVESALDRGIRTDRIDCDGSGQATVHRIDNSTSGEPTEYRVDYEECDSQGYQLDGSVRGTTLTADDKVWAMASDNLSWHDAAGSTGLFRGRVSQQTPAASDGKCAWFSESVNLFGLAGDPEAVLVTSGERSYTFADANGVSFMMLRAPGTRFETQLEGMDALLEGGLGIASRTFGGHAFQLLANGLTTVPASDSERVADGSFIAGGLSIQADDGSRLLLGDFSPSSEAGIVIINSEGRHDIQTPWTSWQSHLPAARALACDSTTDSAVLPRR